MSRPITFDRFIRGAIYFLVFCLALALIDYLSDVLLPFFLAWGIAFLIYPLVIFFQKKCHFRNRTISILFTMLVLLLAIGSVLALIIPSMVQECIRFGGLVVSYFQKISESNSLPKFFEDIVMPYISEMDWAAELENGNLVAVAKEVVPGISGLLSQSYNLIMSLVGFCAILLYIFFILMDYEQLSRGWQKILPVRQRTEALHVTDRVRHNMGAYFRGQSLIVLCVSVLFSTGFLIIDFPMAIGLGILVGLMNYVPYLQLVGLVPTVLLALLKSYDTGQSFWLILLSAIAVFVVVQLIQDMILTPKIMGKVMGLNPAIMLLALSIWGAILGFIGLIIALPMTNLILAYINEWLNERDAHNKTSQHKDPPSLPA